MIEKKLILVIHKVIILAKTFIDLVKLGKNTLVLLLNKCYDFKICKINDNLKLMRLIAKIMRLQIAIFNFHILNKPTFKLNKQQTGFSNILTRNIIIQITIKKETARARNY